MRRRILITAGGTGGHVFPAQGLAQQLSKQQPNTEILFVAGGLASNRYFDRSSFSFKEVACSPLVSSSLLKSVKGCINLVRGFYQSLHILKDYQPHVVVGFGSYYTIPILLAARWLKIPFILHEANSVPGKANKWFAPYADYVGVYFPYTSTQLKAKVMEVGMPLREGYEKSSVTKEEALAYFGLEQNGMTVLICGGSQGAQAINRLIERCLEEHLNHSLQFIHLTGQEDLCSALKQLYAMKGIKACVKAFEIRMNQAWTAADLFIGRAGASTIAEAMEFEVPGILIPYPNATDQHQEKNADFLVGIGGGMKINEKSLTLKQMKEALKQMTQESNLQQMRLAIHHYKKQPHRMNLCQLVLKTAEKKF